MPVVNIRYSVASIYRRAAYAKLVSFPDANALARARRAYRANLAEPGDCKNDPKLLIALAIAQADVGVRPGWIPGVQALACRIAATF